MAFPTATVEIDFADDPIANYQDFALMLSPLSYYRMDDASGATVADSSGNGVHLGLLNSGLSGSFAFGQPSALSGDVDSSLGLNLTNSADTTTFGGWGQSGPLSITYPAAGFSVDFWLKRAGVGHRDCVGGLGLLMTVDTDDFFKVSATADAAGAPTGIFATSSGKIDTNWHHIAVTFFDPTPGGPGTHASVLRIYVDGVDVTVTNPVGPDRVSGSAGRNVIALGGSGGTSVYFTGLLDEIVSYPVTLTAAQVAGHYASARISNPLAWTDVTTYFIGGTTKHGRQLESDQIEQGDAQASFDDTDSRFEPTNSQGPYYGNLLPLRRIRKKWTLNGTTYTRFSGLISAFPLVWERPSEARAELTLIDGFEQLQQADISSSSWSAELAGARINHVLDACLWPRSLRRIDTGYATVQATAFVAGTDQAGLAHIQDVCDTELGYFFISADGYATFHDRYHRDNTARSRVSQATFGDGAGQLPYEEVAFEYTKDRILNDVTTTRSGGIAQNSGDGTSLAHYYRRSLVRSTIATTDDDAATQSRLLVSRYKDARLRVTSMRLAPATLAGADGDAMWAQVLGAEIGDRFTVIASPPGGGDQITQDCYLEQIVDEYPSDVQWSSTWQLSPTPPNPVGLYAPSARFPVLISRPGLPIALPHR